MPGVLALLPEYAGHEDPVPEVRAAALAAAAWLAEAGPVTVVGDEQGCRVGRHLLAGAAEGDGVGVPRGGERQRAAQRHRAGVRRRASGPLRRRRRGGAARSPTPTALEGLDVDLAAPLLVGNPAGLVRLGTLLRGAGPPMMDYAGDPYGVQYWVMRWTVVDSEEPHEDPARTRR